MSHPFNLNIPISKIDEEQRMVWGYATVEEIDSQGEIIGYEASKRAFPNWLGNIREMHGSTAVGKAIEIKFDDDNKGVWLGSKISESADGENAWIKVKEGILAGYSIGGSVNSFKTVKAGDGKEHLYVDDYTLHEVSLVDNPACPSALLQVVKSANGGLQRVEELKKGAGRPIHWWETAYKYADKQNVKKATLMLYNKNSMAKSERKLIKDIFGAYQLIDLAACLADYIWVESWEGENVDDLKAALETIKQGAVDELNEPEDFPEPLAQAIELAAKALNITKAQEFEQIMASKAALNKTVQGEEKRDADGKPVQEATTEPSAQAVTVNKPAVEAPVAPAKEEEKPAEKTEEAAATEEKVEEKPAEAPAAPAEEAKTPEAPAEPAAEGAEKAASAGDLKLDLTADITKSLGDIVKSAVAEATAPLKERLAELEKQPADSKITGSFVNVDKVADAASQKSELQKQFDEKYQRAQELAANPELGTDIERMTLGKDLRKLSRLMDPASVAKHAQVRAAFSQPDHGYTGFIQK